MATAIIRSIRNSDPVSALDGVSRNDLIEGDVVSVQYVGTGASTYSWSIVYAPESSTATFSGVSTNPSPGTFTVDKEGSYLIRLIVNAGIAGEDTQFLRLRALTKFGSLHFVAAGERRDATAVIPVDITPVGWADDQNRNLKTLLDFVKPLVSSGRVVYVDANDGTSNYADYSSIQDAIDFAESQIPSESSPYVILVRAGLYEEDLTFKPHINIVGWSGDQPEDDKIIRVRAASVNGFGCSLPNVGDKTNVVNIHIEGTIATANALVTKTGFGTLGFYSCTITSEVGSVGQGATIDHQEGDLNLDHTKVVANDGGDDLNFAYMQSGQNTNLFAKDCTFHAPSCLEINNLRHNAQGVLANFERCDLISTGGVNSFAVRTGGNCSFDHSFIETNTGKAYSVNPTPPLGNTISGNIVQQLRWSFVDGGFEWDIDETLGANELRLGSVEYGSFSQTGTASAPPYNVTRTALIKGDSLYYDNSTTAIAAANVQDAIDAVHGIASTAVQSASNVGTGQGAFKQKAGTNLEFKSFTGGTDISVTPVGDDLEISYTGGGLLSSNQIIEDNSSVTVIDNGIANGTITFNIEGTDVWQVDGNGDFTPMADSTYNIGTSSLHVANIYNTGLTFDTNNSLTGGEGVLTWNGADGTLDLGLKGGNVTLQIGQEEVFRAKNDSGTNMSDGTIVYITGSDGTNVTIDRANANSTTADKTIGVVTESINSSNKGFVTTHGIVRGLNLNPATYSDGDVVYLSTTDGVYTKTAPTFPNRKIEIGYVVNAHATQGELFVNIKDIHLENWEEDASGNFLPFATNTYNIGSPSYRVDSIYVNAVSSVHFVHDDGVTVHDWALNVDITDVNNPVLNFNGASVLAASSSSSFSGNYNDLTNKPTNLSDFTNDLTLNDFSNDLTSVDWSIVTSTPTTIAGYGITDSIVLSDTAINNQPVRQHYPNQQQFPSATDWHGAIAHSHSDGAMYFAHGASWNKLANATDIPTDLTDLGINDGSNGQVLTTNGNGAFSFTTVSSGSSLPNGTYGQMPYYDPTNTFVAQSGVRLLKNNSLLEMALSLEDDGNHDNGSGLTVLDSVAIQFNLEQQKRWLIAQSRSTYGSVINGDYDLTISRISNASATSSDVSPSDFWYGWRFQFENANGDPTADFIPILDGSLNSAPNIGNKTNRVYSAHLVAEGGLYLTHIDGTSTTYENVLKVDSTSPTAPILLFGSKGSEAPLAYQSAVTANTTSITNNTASINNTNANVANKIEYTDLSVTTATASGIGSLSYINTSGEFVYTPPDRTEIVMNNTYVQVDDVNSGASDDARVRIFQNNQETWTFDKTGSLYNRIDNAGLGLSLNPLGYVHSYRHMVHFDPNNTTSQDGIYFEDSSTSNSFFVLKMNQTNKRLEFQGNQLAYNSEISASGIAYTDLSVTTSGTPSGGGSLSYNNANGVFTFTPAVEDSISDGTSTLDFDGSNNLQLDGGHFLPTTNELQDLGSATNKWRDLYISQNTIYMGDNTLSLDVADPADKHLKIDGVKIPTKFAELLDVDNASSATEGHVLKRKADGRFEFSAETSSGAGHQIGDGDTTVTAKDAGATGSSITFKVDNVSTVRVVETGLLPVTSASPDLGSSTKHWKDIHTREMSIYNSSGSLISAFSAGNSADTVTSSGYFKAKGFEPSLSTTALSEANTTYLRSVDQTGGDTQHLPVFNTPPQTWKGEQTSDTRTNISGSAVVPVYAVSTERIITLLSKNFHVTGSTNEVQGQRINTRHSGSTAGEFGTYTVTYQGDTSPPYIMLEGLYPSSSEDFTGTIATELTEMGFYPSGVIMQSVFLDDSVPQDTVVNFSQSVHVDQNVRGIGSYSYNNENGTPYVSFVLSGKGIEWLGNAAGGGQRGIRVGVYATKYDSVEGGWKSITLNSVSTPVYVPPSYEAFTKVISLRLDNPYRLTDIEDRFGEIRVLIQVYFGDSETAGTKQFVSISNVRLHTFSS